MKIIYTNKGEKIFVDDEDYNYLNEYNWYLDNDGYALTSIYDNKNKKQKYFRMHRLIMNPEHDMVIDHIDGIRHNNVKSNLRICTRSENCKNIKKYRGSSKYKGVSKIEENKFYSSIKYDNNAFYIGIFTDEIACANAYNYYAIKYHGEFANLNDCKHMDKKEWEKYKINQASKYRGVSLQKRTLKWQSSIMNKYNNKREHLGTFKTDLDACIAYNNRAVELYGKDYKNINRNSNGEIIL